MIGLFTYITSSTRNHTRIPVDRHIKNPSYKKSNRCPQIAPNWDWGSQRVKCCTFRHGPVSREPRSENSTAVARRAKCCRPAAGPKATRKAVADVRFPAEMRMIIVSGLPEPRYHTSIFSIFDCRPVDPSSRSLATRRSPLRGVSAYFRRSMGKGRTFRDLLALGPEMKDYFFHMSDITYEVRITSQNSRRSCRGEST